MTYKVDTLEDIGKAQLGLLLTISRQLETLAMVQAASAQPNHKRNLAEYAGFDWQSIGAQVISEERPGLAAVVEWFGFRFVRRSADGKMGKAIWFSRHLEGSGEAAVYIRLITFKDWDVEPLAVEPPAPSRAQPAPAEVRAAAPAPTRSKAQAQPAAKPDLNEEQKQAADALRSAVDAIKDKDEFFAFANAMVRSNLKPKPGSVQRLAAEQGDWNAKALALLKYTLAA